MAQTQILESDLQARGLKPDVWGWQPLKERESIGNSEVAGADLVALVRLGVVECRGA